MAVVAVSISPTGRGPGVGAYVAAAIRVLEEQDAVRFEPGPMFTTLEGDLDSILALIRRMQEAVFAMGAERVGTVIKIDDRRDKEATISGKMASLRAHCERDGTPAPGAE